MSSPSTTAEYIAQIDRIDLHLLSETLLRVSSQLGLPRIQVNFTTAYNLRSEKKSLSVSVENNDGKCSMRFALLVNADTAEDAPAEQTSGAK